jgi:Ulp1 family protease
LENDILDSKIREKVHIFNSHFFSKLNTTKAQNPDQCSVNYDNVKKWTRHVDIFSKDFLFFPICEHEHWCLIIVCYPNEIFERILRTTVRLIDSQKSSQTQSKSDSIDQVTKRPKIEENNISQKNACIMYYDSLNEVDHHFLQLIRKYLECEYFSKKLNKDYEKYFFKWEGVTENTLQSFKPKVISPFS